MTDDITVRFVDSFPEPAEQLVGWTIGWFQRPDRFVMANSGVVPTHRRLGVYSRLAGFIIEGTQFSDHLGLQVQLVRHTSQGRADVFTTRATPFSWPS